MYAANKASDKTIMKTRTFIAVTTLAGALLVPAIGAPCAQTTSTTTQKGHASKTILETAAAAGSFKTLAAALHAAGLTEALSGHGPFTVFAPTDEAFAKLPEGTVESLLKPENKAKLQAILKYHVVAGKVGALAAISAKSAATLQGGSVHVTVDDGKVKINESTVVKPDIQASNGIIHVIDNVLLPAS
jgi:uncharacterized surface protein with fasciclin (FAS1) repeats